MANLEPTKEQEQKYHLEMYLDTFPNTFENVVDSTLDKAINSIISIQNEYDLIAKNSINIVSDDPEEDYINEMSDYYDALEKLENQRIVFALYELRIIYLYKYFEIRLKELSHLSFEDWPTDREVFKWDDIIKFYLSKDINLKKFKSYQSVFDLSRVNNSLKHSGNKIGRKIENIPEFKKISFLESEHLQAFYLRVNEAPQEFLKGLASKINNKLFPNLRKYNEFEFEEIDYSLYPDLPF